MNFERVRGVGEKLKWSFREDRGNVSFLNLEKDMEFLGAMSYVRGSNALLCTWDRTFRCRNGNDGGREDLPTEMI